MGLTKEFEIDTTVSIDKIQKQVTKELNILSKDYHIKDWVVCIRMLRVYVYKKG